LKAILNLVRAQPVYTMGLVQAAIGLATAFGLGWTGQQIGAVMIFSAAVLTFITQKIVTPVAAPILPSGSVVSVQGTEDKVSIG